MDYISQLPKCVLSYILTKLSTRDLFKTSVLSKWWFDFVVLPPTRDLNFDIHNMLGSEKELVETGCVIVLPRYKSVDLDRTRDEFVKRVDQFLNDNNNNHFQVDSFLLNFHLHHHQTNFIDQWLSFAIAMGVASINLHFKGMPYRIHGPRGPPPQPYKFPLALFFGGDANANAAATNANANAAATNANANAAATNLKHLSLQYCVLSHDHHPIFKNLRSLTLDSVKGLHEMFITTLLSNSPLLEKLCLLNCEFISSTLPKIASSSLCHFEVEYCNLQQEDERQAAKYLRMSFLDCPKLTSLKIHGSMPVTSTVYINTPMLNNLDYHITLDSDLNAIALFATLPKLEILHLEIACQSVKSVASSFKTTPLKHLKQLNIIIHSHLAAELEYFDVLGILTILQTSPLVQKLSVMVTDPELYENQNDFKDTERFSHDEVKVIELGGCVGNCSEAGFVKNVLKYTHKLEQVVLSPYWKEKGEPDWQYNPRWFLDGRERIIEKLQAEEVRGLAKLKLV